MKKITGLPEELGIEEALEKEEAKIRVYIETRRFGKPITIIEGIRENVKEILKELRRTLACGGTFKNNHIELQGDHRKRIKEVLVALGFKEEQIEIL
ncbi:MAG: stress response translation initiation inhibitor YciH [Candidatus Aenigmarchaeota archaeon]|jgi:translation initiation factor 1|nr:stress response translation initiation inhibitor YciH [Candidatus Aenigmarchaeota archaeon]